MTLTSRDFPPDTPLHHFFAWNEAAWLPDRRYKLARNPERLPSPLKETLVAAIGNPDGATHAAVFAALDQREHPTGEKQRRILLIRLSALGDFIQSLGPIAAIRRHHRGDHISLLTTRPLAAFARELGYFDEVIIDERPPRLDVGGWLRLRRRLRAGGFDRVYDLQTSDRSSAYAWLFWPGPMPEWSGIAWRCSYPHANRDRDPQHTLDKQAEQLLMAGIFPTPLPALPPLRHALPAELAEGDFVLLVPGSSPQHPEKRWPAERFGELARALAGSGHRPVLVGTKPEAPLGAAIRKICPEALDLIGHTELGPLGALAQHAALTVGNDTGVCHLAAAAGCAVIALFSGRTDPARCAPRGRLVKILAAPDLRDLSVDTVIAQATAILRSRQHRIERATPASANSDRPG